MLVLFSISLIVAESQQWMHYGVEYSVRAQVEHEGTLWIGTKKGLVQVDTNTGDKVHYDIYNSDLPDNEITALAVSEEGILWIGVKFHGVVRYDGEQWVVFDENNSGLPGNYVRDIHIDDAGGIWFAHSLDGVSYYDGEDWIVYNTDNSGLPHYSVSSVFVDSNGDKWFTTSPGVAYFDDEEWIIFASENTPMEGKSFYYITECEDNLIWIATSAELASFDKIDDWQIYNMQTTSLPFGGNMSIAIDQTNTKWISTGFGLVSYDDQDWTVYNKNNSGIPDDECLLVSIDNSDIIWVSVTVSEQYMDIIAGFDGVSWEVINPANSELFPDWQIYLEIDNDGVLWIPFSLYFDEDYIAGFTTFDGQEWTHHYSPDSFIKGSFMIDEDNNKWIGTNQGLYFYDESEWIVYNTSNSGLPNNQVNAVAKDLEGGMWIGTDAGLAHFDGEEWTVYYYYDSPLPHPKVTAITVDQNGDKWIGTDRSSTMGGVVHIDGENWTVYDASNSEYPPAKTYKIEIDSNNDKWFATSLGLVHFDDEQWTRYHEDNSGIPYNVVRDVKVDQNGDVWISMGFRSSQIDKSEKNRREPDMGVAKFDGTAWEHWHYLNSPISVPFAIAIDQHQNIWIGDAAGLIVFNEGGIVSADEWEVLVPQTDIATYNYPNPFNPSTTIAYDLPQEGSVKIEIFNIRGQKVRTLLDEYQRAGKHQIVWNGKDERNIEMPSGIYLYQIATESKDVAGKMMMIK
jgi:ligand-binding sensor domain-containing protein